MVDFKWENVGKQGNIQEGNEKKSVGVTLFSVGLNSVFTAYHLFGIQNVILPFWALIYSM